jgi:hypothetical protein
MLLESGLPAVSWQNATSVQVSNRNKQQHSIAGMSAQQQASRSTRNYRRRLGDVHVQTRPKQSSSQVIVSIGVYCLVAASLTSESPNANQQPPAFSR